MHLVPSANTPALPGGYFFCRCHSLGIRLEDLACCEEEAEFLEMLHKKYRQAARHAHPDAVEGSRRRWLRVQSAYALLQRSGWRQWRYKSVPSLPVDLPLPWAKGWH